MSENLKTLMCKYLETLVLNKYGSFEGDSGTSRFRLGNTPARFCINSLLTSSCESDNLVSLFLGNHEWCDITG